MHLLKFAFTNFFFLVFLNCLEKARKIILAIDVGLKNAKRVLI